MSKYFSKLGIWILLCSLAAGGCRERSPIMSGSTTGPGDEEIDWSVPESPAELMELSRRLKQRSDAEIELLVQRLKFDAPDPAPALAESLSTIADELLSLTLSEADRLGSLLENQDRATKLVLTIIERQTKARAAIEAIHARLLKLPDGYHEGDIYIADALVTEKLDLSWIEKQTGRKYEQVVGVSFEREEYDLGPTDTNVSDSDMRLVGMLTGLRKLDIQQSQVTDQGLSELKSLQHLEELNASNLKVTPTGWASLTQLANLRKLTLRPPEDIKTNIGWVGEFPKLEYLQAYGLTFSRADLLELCRCRTLRKLQIGGDAPNEEVVIQQLPQLQELEIGLTLAPDQKSASLRVEQLPKLENLNPSVHRDHEDPGRTRLESLELSDLPRVRSVYLQADELGPNAFRSFGRLPALKYLQPVKMTIPAESFREIEGLENLTHLECATDRGDTALQSLSNIKPLTHLRLSADEVTDSGLAAVSELRQLEALSLTGIKASNELSAYISKLINLKELNLGDGACPEITIANHPSLDAISLNLMEIDEIAFDSLPHLTRFEINYGKHREIALENLPDLSWCSFSFLEPERIESFRLAELPGLTHFSIGPTNRDGSLADSKPPFDLGDEFLAQFVPMSRLKSLWLRNVLVTDEALMQLAQHPDLDSLDLIGPNLTREGVKRLDVALDENRRKLREQRKAEAAANKSK